MLRRSCAIIGFDAQENVCMCFHFYCECGDAGPGIENLFLRTVEHMSVAARLLDLKRYALFFKNIV